MPCDLADSVLCAYFDGELSASGKAKFERHLQGCPDCIAELAVMNSVRNAATRTVTYQVAPGSLLQKINADLRVLASMPSAKEFRSWYWLSAVAAVLLVAAIVREHSNRGLPQEDYGAEFAAGIVDAHLRSLLPGQLTNINSTDPSTVKAWFKGKVKLAFPVRDFGDQGFALKGGRLDVVQGRTVVALVYRNQEHVVDVFAWATRDGGALPRVGARQGLQWIDWRKDKVEFCVVSDAAPAELDKFRRLLMNSTTLIGNQSIHDGSP